MPNPQVLVKIHDPSLAPLVQNRRLLKMKNPNFCWDDHYLIWRRERIVNQTLQRLLFQLFRFFPSP